MHFFFYLGLFSAFTSSVNEPITYQTISLHSRYYLAANDWGSVPVDRENGEDVNSRRYGKVYYPPSIAGTDKKEARITISRSQMDVEVDLLNTTSNVYIISSIVLEIIDVYDVSGVRPDKGEWELGSRTSDFRPNFNITGEKTKIVVPVEDLALWPQEEYMDSRFIFEIAVEDGDASSGKIFAYTFSINFINAEKLEEKLQVTSDKTYFIAAK